MIWLFWLLMIVMGACTGFTITQLIKNYKANTLVRKASPLHLGIAVDKLTKCCNAYVTLIGDANRLFGVQTTPTMFAINSHLIYSVACLRSIVTSLSTIYLIPGHAEYQMTALKYWASEVYPQHKIITDYSRDASQIPELKKGDATDIVSRWAALAEVVCAELKIIHEYITTGLQGGVC